MKLELMLFLAVALAATALLTTAARLSLVLFTLGALLPIWSIGPIPPIVFDLARYGVACVLILRLWIAKPTTNRSVLPWCWPLLVAGTLITLFSWWRGETPIDGALMLGSVALAWAVMYRVDDPWPLFIGFASSATISGAVLLMSATGASPALWLVPNQDPGAGRLTGLSSSAIRVSIELAVAVAVWITVYRQRRHRTAAVVALLVVVFALLVSGGRTGLLGLTLAAIIAVYRGWIRLMIAAITAVIGWVVVRRDDQALTYNTLDRITGFAPSGTGDFTSGRTRLLEEAWKQWLTAPFTGPGPSAAHVAAMYAASLGGLLAGLLIAWLTIKLGVLVTSRRALESRHPGAPAAVMTASILLVTALLEPYGPFFGFNFTLLTLASVAVLSSKFGPASSVEVNHGSVALHKWEGSQPKNDGSSL